MATYEELRDVTIDILLGREQVAYSPTQWQHLKIGVKEVLSRRAGVQPERAPQPVGSADAELLRDIFWDLFRQGFITLGMDDSNAAWPFFRLSHFGQQTLSQNRPYHYTNADSYLAMVRSYVPDLDDVTVMYLSEAVNSFYAGCMLSACVMLGVAAEHRFDQMLTVGSSGPTYGARFQRIQTQRTILQRIREFQNLWQSHEGTLPSDVREDLGTNLSAIQALIRVHRNESGHPTGEQKDREQVYILLQLFAPCGRKLSQLAQYYQAA